MEKFKAQAAGLMTRYLQKYLGFKGMTFVIATVAMFLGVMNPYLWASIAMAISGLKSFEDHSGKHK